MTVVNEAVVREISTRRGEPDWMLERRLAGHRRFEQRADHRCGRDLSVLDFDDVDVEPSAPLADPPLQTSDSEVVYQRNSAALAARGVVFCDMDTAVRDHPSLVEDVFGTVVSPEDNPYAALNAAAWSGGSFIYVPPGVEVELPLQTHGRPNSAPMGPFERTLIVADEGATVHYIEGCSAPTYSADSLHAGVVEVIVKASARVTHTTIQNWSDNVRNLVTKRAHVEAEGHMTWLDAHIGSKHTISTPAVVLAGPKARGEVRSVAFAGTNQHHDTGATMIHAAAETTSTIVSKSVSQGGGRVSSGGLVRVEGDAVGSSSRARRDALVLDDTSMCDTYPAMEVDARDAVIGHHATVARVADDQLFYLQARGLTEKQATGTIVNGFIEPVTRALPMEYAVEWARLIELQIEGSIG